MNRKVNIMAKDKAEKLSKTYKLQGNPGVRVMTAGL